jgi:hypothetical protein
MATAKNPVPLPRPARSGPEWPRTRLRNARDSGCVALLLTVLAFAQANGPASAETIDRWQPLQNVGVLDNVVLRIHWFRSPAELREAAKNSGQEIKETDLKGFSFLKRNTHTGDYVCDVYVVKMAGGLVDRDRTTTFGHEILHCLGLHHD